MENLFNTNSIIIIYQDCPCSEFMASLRFFCPKISHTVMLESPASPYLGFPWHIVPQEKYCKEWKLHCYCHRQWVDLNNLLAIDPSVLSHGSIILVVTLFWQKRKPGKMALQVLFIYIHVFQPPQKSLLGQDGASVGLHLLQPLYQMAIAYFKLINLIQGCTELRTRGKKKKRRRWRNNNNPLKKEIMHIDMLPS